MNEETRKRLEEIDAMVTRMRSTPVEEMSSEDMLTMMAVASDVMRTEPLESVSPLVNPKTRHQKPRRAAKKPEGSTQ